MLIKASNAIGAKCSVRAFTIVTAIGVSLAIYSTSGIGAITAEEAAQLGGDVLTPMGSIRAGNESGTIPEWTGGISAPPAGFDPAKDNYINPYADEEPLFTITRENYQQYKDKMTVGQQALFERYPDYYMPVYPSHRSAAWPEWVYEQTKKQATHVNMCGDSPAQENCLKDYIPGGGLPFPLPKNGMEALWSVYTAYRYGKHSYWPATRIAIVTPGGNFAYNERNERHIFPWWMEESEKPVGDYWKKFGGVLWGFVFDFNGGPRMVGQIAGGMVYTENLRFDAYIYLPGQRRVRKAPEIGYYDQPGVGSDGLIPTDMRWGFFLSGEEQWFDWKIVGDKEIYVPTNSYDLLSVSQHDTPVPWTSLIKAGHIDQQFARYEMHRVTVLEGNIRPGNRHLTPRIVAYIDRDSWNIPYTDRYDEEGRLWRVYEGFQANFYDSPGTTFVGEVFYDVLSDRYATASFPKAGVNFDPVDPDWYTPQGMRRFGTR